MAKSIKRALFIFRRDLRVADNAALIAAAEASAEVVPCFIFDPRQLENNPYRSDFLLRFMFESLKELADQIAGQSGVLNFLYGEAENVLQDLLSTEEFEAVFINRDYSPFARKRDSAIEQVSKKLGTKFFSFDDALLNAPGTVVKDDGKPYTIYTPFMKRAKKISVANPRYLKIDNFSKRNLLQHKPNLVNDLMPNPEGSPALRGGRTDALERIKKISTRANYKEVRDFPAHAGTTGLSPHNKFGTCSVREVYHAVAKHFGPEHTLINELYWRDFFSHIAFHFPEVIGQAFQKRFQNVEWENDKKKFIAWCEGRTGFPIVDAGMRELNQTGIMHNRVRMIVASFLTKDLHIDWRWGEKYFAQKLVDYDVSVNNGNWQWAASTGCDAQPYFRIFNPWLQQEKFDPDCVYIKRWVEELRDLSSKEIHSLSTTSSSGIKYPSPIVDHKSAKEITIELYGAVGE